MGDRPNDGAEFTDSRFTCRPAIAITVAGRMEELRTTADAVDLIHDVTKGDVLRRQALHSYTVHLGRSGRGSHMPVPVVVWDVEVPVARVRESSASPFDPELADAAASVVARLSTFDVTIDVSRGMAALLASAYVTKEIDRGAIGVIEAVEEPSAIRGIATPELHYVGIEPWVVLIVNDRKRLRYISVVNSDGSITGALVSSMGEWEALFYSW